MKTCVIIGAAPCKSLDFLSADILEKAFVFAADGGYATAVENGIKVDAFIGDLDSNIDFPKLCDVTVLPCEKDYSDVHTVVSRALREGYEEIYLIGCSNGRADHYFANVSLLELIHKSGAKGALLDECNTMMFISEGVYNFERERKYFSIIPLDETLLGVTLRGFKYPLENAILHREMPIAISNEWTEKTATVEIKSGRALVIFSEDDRK